MQIFWVVVVVVAVAGLAVLFARALRGGDREVGMPTSVDMATHDEPPPWSDADIGHRTHERDVSAAERAQEMKDIDRSLGSH